MIWASQNRLTLTSDQYLFIFIFITQEDKSILPIVTHVFTDSDSSFLSDVSFTLQDAKKQLDNLRIDKSPGSDGLFPRLLAEV